MTGRVGSPGPCLVVGLPVGPPLTDTSVPPWPCKPEFSQSVSDSLTHPGVSGVLEQVEAPNPGAPFPPRSRRTPPLGYTSSTELGRGTKRLIPVCSCAIKSRTSPPLFHT